MVERQGTAYHIPCIKLYANDVPRQLEVNAPVGTPFENDVFVGESLFLHRPYPEQGDDWQYAEHFRGASRRWELRFQGVFKTDPGEVFFGAELAQGIAGGLQHTAFKWFLKFLIQIASFRGVSSHSSFEFTTREDGSEVRPHFVVPLFSAQAIQVTPKGKPPPSITRPMQETPKKDKTMIHLNTDDTFTFGFWFKHVDLVRWELCNILFNRSRDLKSLIGDQSLHLVAYSIRQGCKGDAHAECNRGQLLRMVCSPPEVPRERTESVLQRMRSGISLNGLRRIASFPSTERSMPIVRLFPGLPSESDGQVIPVNSSTGIPFETDLFVGEVLFLQRPSPEPSHDDWPYASHFKSSLRRWEMRCQGKFKRLPGSDIYFGAELRQDTSLTWSKRQVANWVLKVAKMLAELKGVWFHHCFNVVTQLDGSRLLPHYVSPIYAAEALYVTPAGETPPPITESILHNKVEEKKAVKFNLEDTYTIGLWNKQLDFTRWEIVNMPMGWTSSLTPFIGVQSIHMIAYALKRTDTDHDPHSDDNKNFILRLEVSPPTSNAEWACHRGLEPRVALGQAAATFHSTTEICGTKEFSDGNGIDSPRRRRKLTFPWLSRCCAWCR